MADSYDEVKALCRPGMSTVDARRVVEFIRERAGDDEVAHIFEDKLREAILEKLSTPGADQEDAEYLAEFARIALSTREIEFSRWCA